MGMSRAALARTTALAMLAFAGNSLLCRLALRGGEIDAASFTSIRLASGAACLWLLVRLRRERRALAGSWPAAVLLFAYAAAFSYAYLTLPASAGALLLFGAVQASMIGFGLWRGERLAPLQWLGLLAASGGLVGLLLPGLSAPPPGGAALMLLAGLAWGAYSLYGRGAADAIASTAGNFVRSVALALPLSLLMWPHARVGAAGLVYALASGIVTSGLGYVIWYRALPSLRATSAAAVQLSVPVIAALGAVAMLGEPFTPRLLAASVAVLGGIATVIFGRRGR